MKRLLGLILSCSLMLSLTGCSTGSGEYDSKIYYVNTDKTSITAVDYDIQATDTEHQISEVIDMLGKDTGEIDYITTIPSGLELKRWELNDGTLELYFVGDYDSLDVYTEVLVRAAIVKSLVQIKKVKSVFFYVNNAPLTDSSGEAVGAMTADTFIDDFGQETDSLLSTSLTLYFASADGMSVVAENRQVYYSRNVSIEKLVMEQLLKGPDDSRLLPALPAGTKLNSISVSDDGVCIANFDATLETAITGVTENVTLYSIVNSLTELDSIKQVQILVNGETPHLSNVEVDLSNAVPRNDSIINFTSLEEEETYLEEDEYLPEDEESLEENTTQE
ncbi:MULTISPECIES: GerMN domain-containing protein [Pseudobutyrivibrio]|uniref:Germination protein M n=1 Tax=Pseudobutyrivibrio xylanivorans TaxID=185007 RepID=A0A1G5RYK0_PSEXY|nr:MULTISPECIES: GerMN domain-containing protein [Pseudobutyrivibrio]MDC7278156.1 GerMN domain-containing protein [Butyrivibrio fibrisolvens]SCZ78521.1 germination protein M [Pseudobutyrivibrio xylanivorans]